MNRVKNKNKPPEHKQISIGPKVDLTTFLDVLERFKALKKLPKSKKSYTQRRKIACLG
jgi:hypothetical protein